MVECNMKDVFNVGYILVISEAFMVLLQIFIFPPEMNIINAASYQSTAGLLIMFYASVKYYKEGREGRIN